MRLRFDPFRPRDPRADAMGVFVPALVLTGLGLVCVYSFGGSQVWRQAIWAVIAIAVALAVSRIPLDRLRRAAVPLLAVCGLLLLYALLFAPRIAGTHRWIVIPSVGFFQPSELAKIAVVLFLAHRLADRPAEDRGLLLQAWPVLVLCLLVLLAPDLGTAAFLAVLAAILMLIGGARIGRILVLAAGTVPVLLLVASRYPYMQSRLDFFRGKLNYQQVQALLALGNGGFLGRGLGAGRQKMFYLPEGHTDFVLPNVGEELGFVGVALIGLLFSLILLNGLRVALAAARRGGGFAFYVACGATFVVVFQALVNIAVATGAAPTKGISLPFLSHGGSNLLISMIAVGLIVNVGRSVEAKA
jgi:cell division protein FtsW